MNLPLLSDRSARINDAVMRHHANATVQLAADGPAWAVAYDVALPEASPFADAATVPQHTVSMWLQGIGDLAEGGEIILTTAHWPLGQRCRVSTPVVPDSSGWAVFAVVPLPPVQPVVL